MKIKNAADAVKYLQGEFSGRGGGPVVTLDLLAQGSGYFEVPH